VNRAPTDRRLGRRDFAAIGALLGMPVVLLSIAALAGYPLLTGDDLTQNYAFSVLSGEFIAHGHLPIYDPYLWSGTPLLAGASAHALLPTTLLFAFLPHLAAWVISEALTLGAATIGAFILLRRNGCRTLAAALGGATFGLGGFVSSQIVHMDFVSASAALIWCLVALDGIVRDQPRRRALWALILAIAVACLGLSGSPDISLDTCAALVVYGGRLLLDARGHRISSIAWAGAGGATGVLLSAVQWLTTDRFVAITDRAHATYSFATSGSVTPAQLLVSVVPHILGGGPIGLETYTGPYNLAELDAYCGILSLVAIVALLPRWRSEHANRWRVWYLIGGIGLVLALGDHTPVEHLILHIPIIHQFRLENRSLILFSMASAMLLSHWVEDQLASEPGRASRVSVACGLVGPVVVGGLVVGTVATGTPYGGLLDALRGSGWSLRAVAPYLVTTAVIAAMAGVVVVFGPSWPRRKLASAIVILVIADLLVFTVNQSSLAPTYARTVNPDNVLQAQLAARLGEGGRYLIVDPSRADGIALAEVGAPDLNVISGLASAQGYSSLTWAPYSAATGTHDQDNVEPEALATGVFDSLNVRVLLTVPDELSTATQSGDTTTPGFLDELRSGQAVSRWFGRSLAVRTVTLTVSNTSVPMKALAAMGRGIRLATAKRTDELPASVRVAIDRPGSREITVGVEAALPAVGLVATNPGTASVGITSVSVTTRSGATYALDGPLAAYLTAPHWVAAGRIGPFAVFSNARARGSFWVETSRGGRGYKLGVRVVQSSRWTPTETVAITAAAPGKVARSVTNLPGWTATGVHDGRSEAITLSGDGLVQSFEVPKGTTVVTFRYEAPGLQAGLAMTAAGLAAMVVLGLAVLASGSPVFKRRCRTGPLQDEGGEA
jgi:hypothetical protein